MTEDRSNLNRDGLNRENGSAPLTPDELFELSAIDAFGLLDEEDRDGFERAFAAAPAPLRRELRRQQSRLVQGLDALEEIDVPASLKERVLDRVLTAAYERQAEARAALGIRDPGPSGRAPKRVETARESGSVAHESGDRGDRRRKSRKGHTAKASAFGAGGVMRLGNRRRVNAMWRPASVGLAVGLVAVLTTMFYMYNDYRSLQDRIVADATIDALGLDAVSQVIFDGNAERTDFVAVDASSGLRAVLFHSDEWDQARLYCERLKQSDAIRSRLVRLAADGSIGKTLTEFGSDGLVTAVPVPVRMLGDADLAIVSIDGSGSITRLLEASVQTADGGFGRDFGWPDLASSLALASSR